MESTRPPCTVSGCTDKIKARGYCTRHYERWRTLGDPSAGRDFARTFEERMARHSRPAGDCQVWTGPRSPEGYGRMTQGGITRMVHIVVWEHEHGPIPRGMKLDHACHNEPCHRLGHLRLVTHKQNLENRRGAHKNSTTGIRGVYPQPNGRFRAQLGHNGVKVYCGIWDTAEEAEAAVVAKRLELFTHSDGR